MKDLMIDLETFGVSKDAVMLSISAVFFNSLTGELGREFSSHISLSSSLSAGFEMDGDTVLWWLGQSKEAQNALLDGQGVGVRLSQALCDFVDFVGESSRKVCVWGNGPSFDCALLANQFDNWPTKKPWKYHNERCVRTVVDLAGGKAFKDSVPFDGVKHDAVFDCKHQIKLVCGALKKIKKEG